MKGYQMINYTFTLGETTEGCTRLQNTLSRYTSLVGC